MSPYKRPEDEMPPDGAECIVVCSDSDDSWCLLAIYSEQRSGWIIEHGQRLVRPVVYWMKRPAYPGEETSK